MLANDILLILGLLLLYLPTYCNNIHTAYIFQYQLQIVLNASPKIQQANSDLLFDKLFWLTVSQLLVYHTLIRVFISGFQNKTE